MENLFLPLQHFALHWCKLSCPLLGPAVPQTAMAAHGGHIPALLWHLAAADVPQDRLPRFLARIPRLPCPEQLAHKSSLGILTRLLPAGQDHGTCPSPAAAPLKLPVNAGGRQWQWKSARSALVLLSSVIVQRKNHIRRVSNVMHVSKTKCHSACPGPGTHTATLVVPVQLQSQRCLASSFDVVRDGTTVFLQLQRIAGISAHGHISFYKPAHVQAVPAAKGPCHT